MGMVNWSQGDWTAPSFEAQRKIVYSDCRDLVEVPGGSDWHIRRLQEDKPGFCWRYPDISSSIQYHHQSVICGRLHNNEYMEFAPPGQSKATVPLFYAVTTHCYSPLDFCVQPKYLVPNRANLERTLQIAYERDADPLKYDELFEGVPCAARLDNNDGTHIWARGKVLQLTKGATTFVRLVDKGTDVILPQSSLRPLLRTFGKLPPLAMKCKLKGVFGNDLEQHKVIAFQQLLLGCKSTVRVELTSTEEPFHVNIYHPTVEGENLGTQFYRPPDTIGHELAKQRRFEEHLRRMVNEESDFDDEDYDEDFDEDDNEAPVQYVRELERGERVYRIHGTNELFCGHVESSRMIALHSRKQLNKREEVEKKLAQMLPTLPCLPESWKEVGTACVVAYLGVPHRGAIEEIVSNEECRVHLVDYGRSMRTTLSSLHVLPVETNDPPYMYVVGLYNSTCYLHPHPTYTKVLKEVLSIPGKVTFELEKGKNNPPRGRIIHEQIGDVSKETRQRLSQLPSHCRFVHPCTSLVSPSPIANLLNHRIDKYYEYRLTVPVCILKGTLRIEELPHID